MFALFNTLEEYQNKLTEINVACSYPNNMGTTSYASLSPVETTDGKYAMLILGFAAGLLAECEQVESVSYPDEFADEINYNNITDRDELKAWIVTNLPDGIIDMRLGIDNMKLAITEYYKKENE